MLWGFVQFAYLDNPLPRNLKDRLFIYLSRFCEIRYCVARHIGFLVGSQSPLGEYNAAPQPVEAVLPLLRRTLPVAQEMLPSLEICAKLTITGEGPAPDTVLKSKRSSHARRTFSFKLRMRFKPNRPCCERLAIWLSNSICF